MFHIKTNAFKNQDDILEKYESCMRSKSFWLFEQQREYFDFV